MGFPSHIIQNYFFPRPAVRFPLRRTVRLGLDRRALAPPARFLGAARRFVARFFVAARRFAARFFEAARRFALRFRGTARGLATLSRAGLGATLVTATAMRGENAMDIGFSGPVWVTFTC